MTYIYIDMLFESDTGLASLWLSGWLSGLKETVPRLGMTAGLYLLLGILELDFAGRKDLPTLWDRFKNITFMLILFAGGLTVTTAFALIWPWEPRRFELSDPRELLFVAFLYLLIFDFLYYWYHRAQHKFSLFWPVHEVHHADGKFNVTTAMRSYWLELPLQSILIITPMLMLVGLEPLAALIFSLGSTAWNIFAHANLRLRFGILTPVLVGPQLHRLHHSKLRQHHDKNFAQFFAFIDVLFGTYCKPGRDEYPPTGAHSLPSDASILEVLLRPFKIWSKKIVSAFSGAPSGKNGY